MVYKIGGTIYPKKKFEVNAAKHLSRAILGFLNEAESPGNFSERIVDDPEFGIGRYGIGTAMGQRILNTRNKIIGGKFRRLEDLWLIPYFGKDRFHDLVYSAELGFLSKKFKIKFDVSKGKKYEDEILHFLNNTHDPKIIAEIVVDDPRVGGPGDIGVKTAARIIKVRNTLPQKVFKSLLQLNLVPYFGPDKFNDLVYTFDSGIVYQEAPDKDIVFQEEPTDLGDVLKPGIPKKLYRRKLWLYDWKIVIPLDNVCDVHIKLRDKKRIDFIVEHLPKGWEAYWDEASGELVLRTPPRAQESDKKEGETRERKKPLNKDDKLEFELWLDDQNRIISYYYTDENHEKFEDVPEQDTVRITHDGQKRLIKAKDWKGQRGPDPVDDPHNIFIFIFVQLQAKNPFTTFTSRRIKPSLVGTFPMDGMLNHLLTGKRSNLKLKIGP